MKDRIIQIMKLENMNQKQFSDAVGIPTASLSNIFSGRTAPTMRHAEAIHKAYPDISISWLLFGEGDIYEGKEDASREAGQDTTAGSTGIYNEGGQVQALSASDASQRSPYGMDSALLAQRDNAMAAGAAESYQIPGQGAYQHIPEVVKYIDKPQRRIVEIRIFFDDGTFETFSGGKR